MRFWDSSALIPLVVSERQSQQLRALFGEDSGVTAWWATYIEFASGIARLEREGRMSIEGASSALGELDALAAAWQEIQPTQALRLRALRLVRVHPLRAGDALQLAAAIVASEGEPRTMPFVTLDDRLALAAEREGFRVIVPG